MRHSFRQIGTATTAVRLCRSPHLAGRPEPELREIGQQALELLNEQEAKQARS